MMLAACGGGSPAGGGGATGGGNGTAYGVPSVPDGVGPVALVVFSVLTISYP